MWDRLFGEVKENYYPFNKYLLKTYRRDCIKNIPEYMHTVYKEASDVVNNEEFVYIGYRKLTAEERVKQILNPNIKFLKGKFDIQENELETVEYIFKFKGEKVSIYLQLPYLKNDAIIIGDTKYYLLLSIIEKVICPINNGFIIKVMKLPLQFWRTETFGYTSTSGKNYFDDIITTKLYQKSRRIKKNELQTTVLLYLLTEFGFVGTLEKLGIKKEQIEFITEEEYIKYKEEHKGDNVLPTEYEFFKLNMRSAVKLYLKVQKKIFETLVHKRVVSSLLYILQFFSQYTKEMLYDKSASFYKVILGKCIYDTNSKLGLAINQATLHRNSLLTYLDPYIKKQFKKNNIPCENIYDLFIYIFCNIDKELMNNKINNLYDKKIGVLELLLAGTIQQTFIRFYDLCKEKKLSEKTIHKLVRSNSRAITSINRCGAVRAAPSSYNGNDLLSILGKKIRQPASFGRNKKSRATPTSKEHKFDPSFIVVESMLSMPSSNPGAFGSINPYCEIDEDGSIIKTELGESLDHLIKYINSK